MEELVAALLATEIQTPVPSPNTDLVETGLLDSLKLVTLLSLIENRFGIQISPDDLDLENFRSVARIANFLQSRQATLV